MAVPAVDEVFLRGLDAFDHVVEEMSPATRNGRRNPVFR
jgi:hypothetical protein